LYKNLLEQLQDQTTCQYKEVGELELRGRQQPATIYEVMELYNSIEAGC